MQKDDLVLIIDDNAPRGHWPLGRVEETIPGKDGVVRAARVRSSKGKIYTRPVVKLIILNSTTEGQEFVREANGAGNVADRASVCDQQAGNEDLSNVA